MSIKDRISQSFNKQQFMVTLGAKLKDVNLGRVEIEFDYDEALTQQHKFIHAGAQAAVVDSSCGYAALTTMPHDADVLSVEFKVNMLRPAVGEKFLATGVVLKAGKRIVVTEGTLSDQTGEKIFMKMVATMIVS